MSWRSQPRVVPDRRDDRPIREALRERSSRRIALRLAMATGRCVLAADEFNIDDPRTFLAAVPRSATKCGPQVSSTTSRTGTPPATRRIPPSTQTRCPERKLRFYLEHTGDGDYGVDESKLPEIRAARPGWVRWCDEERGRSSVWCSGVERRRLLAEAPPTSERVASSAKDGSAGARAARTRSRRPLELFLRRRDDGRMCGNEAVPPGRSCLLHPLRRRSRAVRYASSAGTTARVRGREPKASRVAGQPCARHGGARPNNLPPAIERQVRRLALVSAR
jgi:hypothetical protein